MPFPPKSLATLALLTTTLTLTSAQSGKGKTTRYWDCCKPSCAWEGKGQVSGIVKTCSIDNQPISDPNAPSGCADGGTAFMCSDQTPWAISDDLAYGFGAVSSQNVKCCACYQLTFTTPPIQGKKMIVQATNTGGDVADAQFDLAMPGGGFGLFDGCTKQWQATSAVWGEQYGGSKTNQCANFPSALQAGCGFRWDWMQGADNPEVDFEEIACPAEIVAKSGCGVGSSLTPAPAPAPVTGGGGNNETETETEVEPAPAVSSSAPAPAASSSAPATATGGDTTTDPVGSDPVGSDPVGSDPVGSDTVGSDPVGSDPVGNGNGGGGGNGSSEGEVRDDECEAELK